MTRCPQHRMANPWCPQCQEAMGWGTPLSFNERSKLFSDVTNRRISRDELKRMRLTDVDRHDAEQRLPKVKSNLGSLNSPPSEIERIAAAVESKTNPPVHDPIAFLRNAAESRLMPLLDTDDFNAVMRWRHNVQGDQS